MNLTQRSYFNLSGNHTQKINDYKLQLYADYFLPIRSDLIPTGELQKFEKTAFDFKEFKKNDAEIDLQKEYLKLGSGYDHCWVLSGDNLRSVSSLYHQKT